MNRLAIKPQTLPDCFNGTETTLANELMSLFQSVAVEGRANEAEPDDDGVLPDNHHRQASIDPPDPEHFRAVPQQAEPLTHPHHPRPNRPWQPVRATRLAPPFVQPPADRGSPPPSALADSRIMGAA